MKADNFALSYPAQTQFSFLEESEKDALSELFAGDPLNRPERTRIIADGRFVSRIGRKLVSWRKVAGERPEIISILDQSFLSEPG